MPTQTPSTPALAIDKVSHAYGERKALTEVSFSVAASSFTVLLGLNGAGKSTLYSLITRLYDTQKGAIRIFGHDVGRTPGEALRQLGVVFQSRTLDMDLSLIQNLLYHAALHGIGKKEALARSQAALARVSLADRAKEKVRDLSGGQMRRVEIARALLHGPKLLLLDEPTVGLDIRSRAEILDHVRELISDEGIGVLWATHLIDEVRSGDKVVVLHQGKVQAKGLLGDVVAHSGKANIRDAFAHLTGIGRSSAGSEAA